MATLSFPSLPADFPDIPFGQNTKKLFKVDGPLSADDSLIEAAATLLYYAGPPDYARETVVLSVEIAGSFTYGPLATVSGTVTGITISLDGADVVTLTDVTADASAVWVAMMGSSTPLATLLSGDDTITGTAGFDILSGYDGNDVINALDGGSTLSGMAGNDRLFGGDGFDFIKGGDGRDRIVGGGKGDSLFGGDNRDVIRGQGGRDYIKGNNGNDQLIGGNGDDTIYGGNDDDTISGGAGNDAIYGGKGDDSLGGGLGDDEFLFSRFGVTGKSGSDIITDFEVTDKIYLGRVSDAADVIVTQIGSDVSIAMADAAIDSLITVLGATAAEVEAAISTSSWLYY